MAILKYIISLLLSIIIISCYKDFNPDIEVVPVLCLNSLITAGEPIEVNVSHTWVFNDEQSIKNHEVTDADVTILANGNIVDKHYLPCEGDRIRIIAESPTYGNATAEVIVPHATPIGKVKVTPKVTNIWRGDSDFYHYEMMADITFNLNIEMDVNDPIEADNYYQFDYSWSDYLDTYFPNDYYWDYNTPILSLGILEYEAEPIFKEHIGVFETVMGSGEDSGFLFFTDRQFSGKTYTLHINFSDNSFRVKSEKYDESLLDCSVNLFLTTVTKSYYNWVVYKWNVDEGIIGDLSDIGFAEPIWGYSNVSSGAGVVAARSAAKYTVNLKDFLQQTIFP